jgi:hypothetical protein
MRYVAGGERLGEIWENSIWLGERSGRHMRYVAGGERLGEIWENSIWLGERTQRANIAIQPLKPQSNVLDLGFYNIFLCPVRRNMQYHVLLQ